MSRAGPLGGLAEMSLRFLLVAAAVAVVALVLVELRIVVLPVIVALLVATVLTPPVGWLRRRGLPASLAALLAMAGAAAALAGLVALVVPSVADELDDLGRSVRDGLDQVVSWLAGAPFGVTEQQVERGIDTALDRAGAQSGVLAEGVLTGAVLVAEVVAGLLLAVVLVFFFLRDGERIWRFLVGLAPARRQQDVVAIGERSWEILGGYVRGLSIVATADAVLIGIALALIGVPLVIPLALLTFIGAFVPLVGAVVAGLVAALVALVSEGALAAGLVLVAIVVIQQLEGDLLYPLVVGNTLDLHPAAILLAIPAGAVVGGVVGVFLSVPLAAIAWAVASHFRSTATPPEGGTGDGGAAERAVPG